MLKKNNSFDNEESAKEKSATLLFYVLRNVLKNI